MDRKLDELKELFQQQNDEKFEKLQHEMENLKKWRYLIEYVVKDTRNCQTRNYCMYLLTLEFLLFDNS